MPELLLALDQGTTSSRAIVFTPAGSPIGQAQLEHPQSFPEPGRVEHDPEAIWMTQIEAARGAIRSAGAAAPDVAAIGIANQRETVVVWDRSTGKPIGPAIVWQDRRTADTCARLAASGAETLVQERTGLVLDPYFSAAKIARLLNETPGARRRADEGLLAFGNIDACLLWRLSGGSVHATDVSNASRTSMMRLDTCEWDAELLDLFDVPASILPEIRSTTGHFADAADDALGSSVPVCAMAGDQQAASFGQACLAPGMLKNTYGTGSFLLLNTGVTPHRSRARLLTTAAWRLHGHATTYALEGSVFATGAAIQWLRDGLGIIATASETAALAASVEDSAGVVLVPAFSGLGAPHWRPDARGAVLGLTRGSSRAHIVRAALEAACFQTRDVLEAMRLDTGQSVACIRADGGMAANDVFLQMQADLAGVPVLRPAVSETTALGAALLAGLGAGVYASPDEAASAWRVDREFEPRMSTDRRDALYAAWRKAVAQVCFEGAIREPAAV